MFKLIFYQLVTMIRCFSPGIPKYFNSSQHSGRHRIFCIYLPGMVHCDHNCEMKAQPSRSVPIGQACIANNKYKINLIYTSNV